MTPSDLELLQRFARDRAQGAFTELVNRHLNLVYSAALRLVRSPQLAEDVAQSVFADLARHADKIRPDTALVAWLHAVTRHTAVDVIRRESRRQMREQLAYEMNITNAPDASWPQIEPLLDEAVAELDETDRAAVLLRFFENKSLRDVGQQLGVSDDAAQKRVSRAVERLREFFAKRGVSAGAGGLVVVISANAVQAAPVGLAVTISAAALAGTAATTSTIIAATTKTIAMTTLQKTLITATVVVLAGTGIYQARQAAQLRDQVQTLQQQQAPLNEQIQQLQSNFDDATNRLVGMVEHSTKVDSDKMELLKLRGEVGVLKQQVLDAANQTKMLRSFAQMKMNDAKQFVLAMNLYANDNKQQSPTNFNQVFAYLGGEQNSVLDRFKQFEIVYHGLLTNIANASTVIVARDIAAWPTENAKWAKVYGFADGHSEIITLSPNEFRTWEKSHHVTPQVDNQ